MTGEVLQVFAIDKSAEVVTGVVTVDVLFEGTGSGVGLLTAAVFAKLPVILLFTVPRMSMETLLPEAIVPTLNGLIQGFQLVPLFTENSGLLILAGTTSVTDTLTASLVPRF